MSQQIMTLMMVIFLEDALRQSWSRGTAVMRSPTSSDVTTPALQTISTHVTRHVPLFTCPHKLSHTCQIVPRVLWLIGNYQKCVLSWRKPKFAMMTRWLRSVCWAGVLTSSSISGARSHVTRYPANHKQASSSKIFRVRSSSWRRRTSRRTPLSRSWLRWSSRHLVSASIRWWRHWQHGLWSLQTGELILMFLHWPVF